MEKYLNKETEKSLEELIDYIKNTKEYKEVQRLKQEIKKDEELMNTIEEVRKYQRQYIKSNYDQNIKKELDKKTLELNENKLFVTYSYYLDKVNQNINIIKEELNNYFFEITNILN